MKNPFRTKYRICTDAYLGFEVQIWRWWFPFWVCMAGNTFGSVYLARNYAESLKTQIVEYL